jgi:hypothetical protein
MGKAFGVLIETKPTAAPRTGELPGPWASATGRTDARGSTVIVRFRGKPLSRSGHDSEHHQRGGRR